MEKAYNIVEWAVDILDAFYDSADALGRSERTIHTIDTLMYFAKHDPEGVQPFPGQFIRIIKTHSSVEFAALRLFYWLDDDGVHIAHVEAYDELLD